MLGVLEQKIMDILWASPGPLKPSAVLSKLAGDNAYTTIMTVLKRMADKKLVKRQLKGNTYYYNAISDKTTFAAYSLKDLFTRIYQSYGKQSLTIFTQIAKETKT